MAEPIEIEIRAEVDEALKGLEGLRKKLKQVDEQAEEAGEGAKKGGLGMSHLGDMAKVAVVGIAAAAAAIAAAVVALKKFGTEVERQSGIINRFHGDISDARERVNGLISDLDLMVAQNKLAAAGIELSAEDMGNLAVAAAEAGAAVGEDATESLNRLTDAVIGGGDELTKFGISLQGTEGRVDEQRAAIEQLGDRYRGTSASADTFGGKMQQVGTAIDNAVTEMIDGINMSSDLSDAFGDLFDAARDLAEIFVGNLGGETGGLSAFNRLGIAVSATLGTMASRMAAFVRALQTLIQGDFQQGIAEITAALNVNRFAQEFDQRLGEGLIEGVQRQVQREIERSQRSDRTSITELQADGGGGGGGRGRRGPSAEEVEKQRQLAEHARNAAEATVMRAAAEEELQRQLDARATREALIAKQLREQEEAIHRQVEAREAAMAAAEKAAEYEQFLAEQEAESAQNKMDTIQQVDGLVGQSLELFGATQGQKELWAGISQVAQAIGSYPDYGGIAAHALSAALHFKNAAEMGVGGGGSARASAPSPSAAKPTRPTASGGGGGGGGGGVMTINYNAPIPEPLIGREQRRAQRAAQRRFGG